MNEEVKYIGKTILSLRQRLYGYKNPGATQITNIKNNKLIKQELQKNKSVDIFSFENSVPLKYGEFEMNVVAGLEDSLIETLKPEWNMLGKKR